MGSRVAGPGDLALVTDVVTLAFEQDPLWGVALSRADGRTDHHRGYWLFFVRSALSHGLSSIADDGAAVSVWLPSDAPETLPGDEAAFEAYLARHLPPDDVAGLHELYRRFGEAHPHREPHHYLSLLGTHPGYRGLGIGQALLRCDVEGFDAAGIPTYLESSNSANDHRYARVGYRPVSSFRAVRGDAIVTGMWRPVGG